MQLATDHTARPAITGYEVSSTLSGQDARYSQYKIIRRNGSVAAFEPSKISIAMTKAFIAVNGGQGAASARVRELVSKLTEMVVAALVRRQPSGGTFHIEDIQDQVELALMRSGEHEVARSYVLYREQRTQERAKQRAAHAEAVAAHPTINVTDQGKVRPLDLAKVAALVQESCEGLGRNVDPDVIMQATLKDLYEGVPVDEVRKSLILSARAMIEKD